MCLFCWPLYEVLFSSKTMQREFTIAFPRQHSEVLCWWQLAVGQQEEGGGLLRFQDNSRYLYIVESDMQAQQHIQNALLRFHGHESCAKHHNVTL